MANTVITTSKHHLCTFLVLLFMAMFSIACYNDIHTTTTIKADGSSTMQVVVKMDRSTFEEHISMMDEDFHHGDSLDFDDFTESEAESEAESEKPAEADTAQADEAAAADDKADSDDTDPTVAWSKALNKGMDEGAEHMEIPREFLSLAVTDYDDDTVTITWSVELPDLRSLITYGPALFEMDQVERLVLSPKINDQGHAKLEMRREADGMTEQMVDMMLMQADEMTITNTMVFPGAVQEAEGWTIDEDNPHMVSRSFSTSDENLREIIIARYSSNDSFTFAPGDLELSDILDSDTLAPEHNAFDHAQTVEEDLAEEDSAAQHADGGQVIAQARVLTTTTLHEFAEAKELLSSDQGSHHFHMSSSDHPGISIEGTLFPPEGRRIIDVEDVRALSAIDDQDRQMAVNLPRRSRHVFGHSHSREELTERLSMPFTIRLPLPDSEIEAIEELTAQAVISTCSEWKSKQLAVDEQGRAAISLEDILPGADIMLRPQESSDERERRVDIMLRGDENIEHIHAKLSYANTDRSHSNTRREASRVHEGQHQRRITLSVRLWSSDDEDPGALQLDLHFPKDFKQERVTFTLEALDM